MRWVFLKPTWGEMRELLLASPLRAAPGLAEARPKICLLDHDGRSTSKSHSHACPRETALRPPSGRLLRRHAPSRTSPAKIVSPPCRVQQQPQRLVPCVVVHDELSYQSTPRAITQPIHTQQDEWPLPALAKARTTPRQSRGQARCLQGVGGAEGSPAGPQVIFTNAGVRREKCETSALRQPPGDHVHTVAAMLIFHTHIYTHTIQEGGRRARRDLGQEWSRAKGVNVRRRQIDAHEKSTAWLRLGHDLQGARRAGNEGRRGHRGRKRGG